MRVAITGHRPDKLRRPPHDYVKALTDGLRSLRATYVYEGQAAGIDLLSTISCLSVPVLYEAVVPYMGHREFNNDPFWQQQWDMGVQKADRVEVLSDVKTYPGPWVFHNRNKYMVDYADVVLSVWDGSPKGGTKACIDYAIRQGRTIYNIDPNTFDRRILHESSVHNLQRDKGAGELCEED